MPTRLPGAGRPSRLLCASMIAMTLCTPPALHAQEAAPAAPAAPASAASDRCAPQPGPEAGSNSNMRVPGGCLLGATLGTFIFPGLGTALGCAGFGAVSWCWGKLTDTAKPPATAQACTASGATPVASR